MVEKTIWQDTLPVVKCEAFNFIGLDDFSMFKKITAQYIAARTLLVLTHGYGVANKLHESAIDCAYDIGEAIVKSHGIIHKGKNYKGDELCAAVIKTIDTLLEIEASSKNG